MTLYRDSDRIFTQQELMDSPRAEIESLDDEQSIRREYNEYGDLAIREYIIEACLVGICSRVDDGEEIAYRRTTDVRVFFAAEIEKARRIGRAGAPNQAAARHPYTCEMAEGGRR